MSTDDLTRRARAAARDGEYDTTALMDELADEVDRLRTANALNVEGLQVELADAIDTVDEIRVERDAARAALERVRGYTRIRVTPFGLTQDESLTWQQGYDAAIERLLTILEGES